MTYRFEHDPESGAFYIKLSEGSYYETIPLGEPGLGAGVDVDADGNVLGVEFLSFEEYAEVLERVGGRLEIPEKWKAPEDATEFEKFAYQRKQLIEALASLPPREQEILRLIYSEGFTQEEVAARLNTSSSEVHKTRLIALSALRTSLEDFGQEFQQKEVVEKQKRSLEVALSRL